MERIVQGASVVDIKEEERSKYQMNEDSLMDSDTNLNQENNSGYNQGTLEDRDTDAKDSSEIKTSSLEENQELVDDKVQDGEEELDEPQQQNQPEPEAETGGENQGGRKGFEFKISEPVTEINQEILDSIYEEHLVWLEALLNPNRKVFSGRANLSGADLSGFNLDGMNFSGASFKDSCLKGASLVGTNFTGADLSGADLSGATCSKTKFKRAILNRARFIGVDLSSCDLSYASQLGTQFEEKETHTNLEEDNDQIKNLAEIEHEYFDTEPETIIVEPQPENESRSSKLS